MICYETGFETIKVVYNNPTKVIKIDDIIRELIPISPTIMAPNIAPTP